MPLDRSAQLSAAALLPILMIGQLAIFTVVTGWRFLPFFVGCQIVGAISGAVAASILADTHNAA